jgi:hypothetical protein
MRLLNGATGGALSLFLISAMGLAVEDQRIPLVAYQSDSTVIRDSNGAAIPWHKFAGRRAMSQGVYRMVTKGYYDRLMIENTSLVLVWDKGAARPEDGTPVEVLGKVVMVTYGGGPRTSQGAPQVRAYGLHVENWKEIRRVTTPTVKAVE